MNKSIAIVGLGLIGGSFALALKKQTEYTVIGIDCNDSVLKAALDTGAVDKIGMKYLNEADVVILALSPNDVMEFLRTQASTLQPRTIVTDVCGVKRKVMQYCVPLCRSYGLNFVGGHPMAGKECSGFVNADETLFYGASYIFVPPEDTPSYVMDTLKNMVMAMGCARVTLTSPENHDRMIAFTSQLPHVLAGAYVKSPCCLQHSGYSAGSYRDVSRVAAIDEHLWSQLFLMNADNLCKEINTLIKNLEACRDAVAAGDTVQVESVLREGRMRKESVIE